jgi:hypothetical protein
VLKRHLIAGFAKCSSALSLKASSPLTLRIGGGGALFVESAFRNAVDEAARDNAREWIRVHPHRASNGNVTRRSLLIGAGIGAAAGAFFGVALAHALAG